MTGSCTNVQLAVIRWDPDQRYVCLIPVSSALLQVADGEDTLWTPAERESGPSVKRRGLEFVQWLVQRPEQRIAVVSHSSFLFFLFANFGRDCSEPTKVPHLFSHWQEYGWRCFDQLADLFCWRLTKLESWAYWRLPISRAFFQWLMVLLYFVFCSRKLRCRIHALHVNFAADASFKKSVITWRPILNVWEWWLCLST